MGKNAHAIFIGGNTSDAKTALEVANLKKMATTIKRVVNALAVVALSITPVNAGSSGGQNKAPYL